MQISTVGIDLAKRVFQIHGVDRDGNVVLRKQLRRAQVLSFFAKLPPCLVGMEACGTSHHWAREIGVLGHEVRLMPPQYVKPYVKRNKHDPADAEACCEAVGRASMRFVPVKTEAQQAVLIMHRARHLLGPAAHSRERAAGSPGRVRDRRAAGHWHVGRLRARVEDEGHDPGARPDGPRQSVRAARATLDEHYRPGRGGDRGLALAANPVSQRLAKIPGIGPLTASGHRRHGAGPFVVFRFRPGVRRLARPHAPLQHSTGGKERLGRISRQGKTGPFGNCSSSAPTRRCCDRKEIRVNAWVQWALLGRCARLKVAVALANKMARIAWAVMAKGESYRRTVPA